MSTPKIQAITIKIPWWLKWSKKYLDLEHRTIKINNKLKGQRVDMIIIDDIEE